MEHRSKAVHNHLQQKRRRNRIIATAGAVCMTGALLLIAGFSAFRHNNRDAAALEAEAERIAHNRNTCTIKSAEETGTIGKPAVKLVISLKTKKAIDPYAMRHDRLGMDVTLADNKGNLISGIRVVNTARKNNNEPLSVVVGSTPGDSPDTETNTMTISSLLLSEGEATYEVFRQNAVDASATGPLVRDTRHTGISLVACGSFTYTPGTHPVFQR